MSLTVEIRVKKVIAKKLGKDPDDIKLEYRFQEDLGADSLSMVEIIMEFEEEFAEYKIEIADDVAEKIKTVGQAVSHIEQAISNR